MHRCRCRLPSQSLRLRLKRTRFPCPKSASITKHSASPSRSPFPFSLGKRHLHRINVVQRRAYRLSIHQYFHRQHCGDVRWAVRQHPPIVQSAPTRDAAIDPSAALHGHLRDPVLALRSVSRKRPEHRSIRFEPQHGHRQLYSIVP